MESNNKLQETDIESRTCYYFDDITKIGGFNFNNILIDEKSYKNILVYNMSYKILIGAKPLRIRFNEVGGFIRIFDGTRYLVLFGPEECDVIFNRIRYLIGVNSSITYVISHYYAKIKVDLYNFLLLEKTLKFHYVKLTKSIFNKEKNIYYYNIFLEKGSYELPKYNNNE